MQDANSVSLNEDDLSVAHLEHVLTNLPDHYVLHFEDEEGNVFLIDKVSLDVQWQTVDFDLKRVTREEQEEVARDLGLDPSILD